jgi:ATP-dependent RNA helicase DDX24/MAK5
MAPEQKKRPRPVPNARQRSKKRQKIEPVKNGDKRRVAVDALPWNEVQMPEMFDDAEGFYGLEEVDGVEIIRDGGTVQFV